MLDSTGNMCTAYPGQITGYWVNNVFYKSFKTIYKDKKVDFFAEEITTGKASCLYSYNGEQTNNQSIYIFKKSFQKEDYFVQENINTKTELDGHPPKGEDKSEAYSEPLVFHDEQPYLQFFQSYLSDCKDVAVKFKSQWYSQRGIYVQRL